MKRPPLRLQHALVFAVVALLFFAWGGLVGAPAAAVGRAGRMAA